MSHLNYRTGRIRLVTPTGFLLSALFLLLAILSPSGPARAVDQGLEAPSVVLVSNEGRELRISLLTDEARLLALVPGADRAGLVTQVQDAWPRLSGQFLVEDGHGRDVALTLLGLETGAEPGLGLARPVRLELGGTLPEGRVQYRIDWAESLGPLVVQQAPTGSAARHAAFVLPGQAAPLLAGEGGVIRPALVVALSHVPEGFGLILSWPPVYLVFLLVLLLGNLAPGRQARLLAVYALGHSLVLVWIFGIPALFPLPLAALDGYMPVLVAVSTVLIAASMLIRMPLRGLRSALVLLCGGLHGIGFALALQAEPLPVRNAFSAVLGTSLGLFLAEVWAALVVFVLAGHWMDEETRLPARLRLPVAAGLSIMAAVLAFA